MREGAFFSRNTISNVFLILTVFAVVFSFGFLVMADNAHAQTYEKSADCNNWGAVSGPCNIPGPSLCSPPLNPPDDSTVAATPIGNDTGISCVSVGEICQVGTCWTDAGGPVCVGGVIECKSTSPAPTVSILANGVNPLVATEGTSVTLAWTVSDATSCTASGDWSGSKTSSGPGGELIGTLGVGNYTYTLDCTGPGGTSNDSVSVTINPGTPVLKVTGLSFDFGQQQVGSPREEAAFRVENDGTGILSGELINVAAPFECVTGCSYNLGPTESQIVTVRFTPSAVGPVSPAQTVTFTSNDTSGGGTWSLFEASNCGADPWICATPVCSTGSIASTPPSHPCNPTPLPADQCHLPGGGLPPVNAEFWQCVGGGGLIESIDVTLAGEGIPVPPPLPTATLSPPTASINIGDLVTLSWTSTDANPNGCEITANIGPSPYSNLPSTGTLDVFPGTGRTYSLVCSNSTGDSAISTSVVSVDTSTAECQDGIDNDGDGLTDFAGGDPGCSSATDNWEQDKPICAFSPAAYDEVVVFPTNTTLLLATGALSDAVNGPIPLANPLVAGQQYEISVHAWDGYPNRVVAAPQPDERFFIEFIGGGTVRAVSAASPDLVDNVLQNQWASVVDSFLTISDPIDSIQAVHSAYPQPDLPGLSNSLHSICVGIRNVTALPECSDGLDNDGDGHIDYPNDPQCSWAGDNDEDDPECSDTVDNDGDGLIDFPNDPGCSHGSDESEDDWPACAFSGPSYSRIISFDPRDGSVLADSVGGSIGEIESIGSALPSGNYEISLHAHDDGSHRITDFQPNERFAVQMLNSGSVVDTSSQTLLDLTDFVEEAEWFDVVDSSKFVSGSFNQVRPVHLGYPDSNPNSVHPICVAFRDVSGGAGPTINTFTATPVVDYGTEATLDWDVTGPAGSTCTIDGPGGATPLASLSGNMQSVSLFDNASFTLECDDGSGNVSSRVANTSVRPSVDIWTTNFADPIRFGVDRTDVMWNVLGPAVNCTASGNPGWAASPSKNPGGGIDQGPETHGPFTAETSFTLTCANANGHTDSDTENLRLYPDVRVFTGVSPVVQGTNTTLNWEVRGVNLNVTGATLSGDDGGWAGGGKAAIGSQVVGPVFNDSTYRVIAENTNIPTFPQQLSVLIEVALPSATIRALPKQQILKGKSTTLEWETENIDPGTCVLTEPVTSLSVSVPDDATGPSAYDTGPIEETRTYTLTCDLLAIGGGTIETSVTIVPFTPTFDEE